MSWMCSVDGKDLATNFCTCRDQETFLCDAHIATHMNKSLIPHEVLSILAHGEYRNPGYFEALKRRGNVWEAGNEELAGNIRLIDVCIEQFAMKVEEIIWKLTQFSRATMSELRRLKAEMQKEIAEGVAEAEAAKYRHSPQLNSAIAKALREFKPGLKSLIIFRFNITQSWPTRMEDILQYEKGLPHSSIEQDGNILPQVFGNRLRKYDLLTGRTTEASLATTFTNGTVFCLRDENTLLCAGGGDITIPPVSTAYLLSLSTAKLTAVESMKTARAWAGIAKHGSHIYIFGGSNNGSTCITTCEKFNGKWTSLPDMKCPRYVFSPCVFGEDIYLPEVSKSGGVLETFNVIREEFKTHPVRLPANWINQSSVSFIVEGELILIARNGQMAKLRIDVEHTFRVSTIDLHREYVFSNVPPMRHGREVFWAHCGDGNLRKFDLATQLFTAY